MPKVKIPRKSTNIDMTAMCDVAFLLLTFFMLATKFKPEEAVEIKTPSSVSSKIVPDKDVCLISLDREGRVYLQMDNPKSKEAVLEVINRSKDLDLNATQFNTFINAPSIGVPFAQLSSLLSLPSEDFKKVKQMGIPIDSVNNEFEIWIKAIIAVNVGKKMSLLLKGDNEAKYEDFKKIIDVFKRNDQYKFQLITMPEDAPMGTPLWETRNQEKKIS